MVSVRRTCRRRADPLFFVSHFLFFVFLFSSSSSVGSSLCLVAPASASPRGISRSLSLSPCWSLCPRSGDFDPPGETGMLVVSEEKCFMVMASTAVEKDAWLRAIRLCMRDLSTNVETRERMCGSQVGRWVGAMVAGVVCGIRVLVVLFCATGCCWLVLVLALLNLRYVVVCEF